MRVIIIRIGIKIYTWYTAWSSCPHVVQKVVVWPTSWREREGHVAVTEGNQRTKYETSNKELHLLLKSKREITATLRLIYKQREQKGQGQLQLDYCNYNFFGFSMQIKLCYSYSIFKIA